ncbi:Spy/CpxP family protein refolding chaperone [Gluconacetobacter takamatsuzukensis]|uniref:Spy/CpxP family protein refolding chaperone n=1 Tax=Gluconacetobacter takamatsuzukensis TaxID=1286190 RepID=A0A7W4KFW0_9PROT|nr:Spy/CpxP family protein refolding chaperone [Gluconacetobacter takamatsuzukensis]MBB2206133.1 Spy/CpxP family protein refolding chaperone [Gluconacetobacter takamatsuzukensis]
MFKKTILAVTVMAGLSATVAQAHDMPPPPPGPGMHGGWGARGGMEVLAGLKLTPAQHKQIHAILQAARKDKRGDWKQEGALHEQIRDLLLTPGPVDRAKLASLTQQIEALHQAAVDSRLDVAVKIHDILTPEQLADAKAREDKIRSLRDQLDELTAPPPPPQGAKGAPKDDDAQ